VRYLLRRFGVLLLTAWVAVTVNFALPRLMPGDPVATMIAQYEGRISPEAAATLRIQFGLNRGQSQLSQYFSYLRNLLSGNLGESFQTFAPVSDTIRQSLPRRSRSSSGRSLVYIASTGWMTTARAASSSFRTATGSICFVRPASSSNV